MVPRRALSSHFLNPSGETRVKLSVLVEFTGSHSWTLLSANSVPFPSGWFAFCDCGTFLPFVRDYDVLWWKSFAGLTASNLIPRNSVERDKRKPSS